MDDCLNSKSTRRLAKSPLNPEIGVLALVADEWNSIWQPRHHVLVRLSHHFQVAWFGPAPNWRKMLKNRGPARVPEAELAEWPGLSVHNPEFWLPGFYRPDWLVKATFLLRLRRAYDALRRRGAQKIILYLWRPEFAKALEWVPSDLSCYHVDDEYSFSAVEKPLDINEIHLMQRVDQVFIHSPALLERKGAINPHTAFMPNGVDFHAHADRVPEPSDLAIVPRPRIGYTGMLKKQLNWPLLLRLAREHPDWSLVFVGPMLHAEIQPALRELSQMRNVYFLGARSANRLSAYQQHFDVCIMPYLLDDYTKYIYPLKLHEYLASGSPVVGSPIRSLLGFSSVVSLASSYDDWTTALEYALRPEANGPEAVSARQSVARQHDWDILVERIAHRMMDGLRIKEKESPGDVARVELSRYHNS